MLGPAAASSLLGSPRNLPRLRSSPQIFRKMLSRSLGETLSGWVCPIVLVTYGLQADPWWPLPFWLHKDQRLRGFPAANSPRDIADSAAMRRSRCARSERHELHVANSCSPPCAGGTRERHRDRDCREDPLCRALRCRPENARVRLCSWTVAGSVQGSKRGVARRLRDR